LGLKNASKDGFAEGGIQKMPDFEDFRDEGFWGKDRLHLSFALIQNGSENCSGKSINIHHF